MQQKEEEYVKYEATQRQLFDAFLMKRGMRIDSLQRSEELKHLIRGGIPREYRAQVRPSGHRIRRETHLGRC